MSKKQSNSPPTFTRPPPPAPPPPPKCIMRTTFFGDEVETKESIQKQREYEIYMRGYDHGRAAEWLRHGSKLLETYKGLERITDE